MQIFKKNILSYQVCYICYYIIIKNLTMDFDMRNAKHAVGNNHNNNSDAADLGSVDAEPKEKDEVKDKESDVHVEEKENTHSEDKEEKIDAPAGDNNKKTDVEIDESLVLNFLSEKRGEKLNSIDELFKTEVKEIIKEVPQEETDEEVASFKKFKQETNGSFSDYMKLNKDWNAVSDLDAAREYLRAENPNYTDQDVKDELRDLFLVGEDLSNFDERDINRANRKLKQYAKDGRNYFEKSKESFKVSIAKKPEQTKPEDESLAKARDFWKKKADETIDSLDTIKFGEYDHAITERENLREKYESLDSLLNSYKSDDGIVDIKRLIKTIEKGERADKAFEAALDLEKTRLQEEFMKGKKNHGDQVREVLSDQRKGLSAKESQKVDRMMRLG